MNNYSKMHVHTKITNNKKGKADNMHRHLGLVINRVQVRLWPCAAKDSDGYHRKWEVLPYSIPTCMRKSFSLSSSVSLQ